MEPQHYQQQQHEERSGGSGGNKSSFLCRQSSTRWIPTTEQIRILRDLYYVNGVRSPNAEQIQKISATLRQYGKIEGKNVFYWFQNHKARERQKKRLTVDIPSTNKYGTANIPPGVVSVACTSPGIYGGGAGHQVGISVCGGGSVLTDRSFGGSCMAEVEGPATVKSSMTLVGMETSKTPWMYQRSSFKLEGGGDDINTREMETLQLFPIHSQEEEEEREQGGGGEGGQREDQHEQYSDVSNPYIVNTNSNSSGCTWVGRVANQASNQLQGFYWDGGHHHLYNNDHHYSDGGGGGGATSLELTLNSYYYAPHGST